VQLRVQLCSMDRETARSFGWWLVVDADLFWEKSTDGWLLVAGLFWEKSTASWWLISQTNKAKIIIIILGKKLFRVCSFYKKKRHSVETSSYHPTCESRKSLPIISTYTAEQNAQVEYMQKSSFKFPTQ
jgi:hypothetical protein